MKSYSPFLTLFSLNGFSRKLRGLDCFTCVYQVVLLLVMSTADTYVLSDVEPFLASIGFP